jgi:hypothetical protein
MSTDYGYICLTDGSHSSCNLTYMDQFLKDMVKVRTQLAEVFNADTSGTFSGGQWGYGVSDILWWLVEHHGHIIAVINEYGEIEPVEGINETS